MKFHFTLFLLALPTLVVSCAKSGDLVDEADKTQATDKKATQQTLKKKVTSSKKQTVKKVTPAPLELPNSYLPVTPTPTVTVTKTEQDTFEKYSEKKSPYGTLKNADVPPSAEELTASPDPISKPPENIITPPTGG